MPIKFYNTLSRQKEPFISISENKVMFYACGPTVYAPAHIGNFRTFVFEDLLNRWLVFNGYQVNLIMNITDVDDKTIKASTEQKIPLKDYTSKYSQIFFDDLQKLNILKASHYPRATAHTNSMILLVSDLLEKKIAYIGEDKSVYFSIKKFKDYGKFANLDQSTLKTGARVNQDTYTKENLSDFVLWKAYDQADGDVFWQAQFGKGRPGWHLECSAMAMECLAKTIDIHAGGVDLIFPHHQNEIAQSESSTNVKFCNYWLHCEHLRVDGAKMSKSLGNFHTLNEITDKGYSQYSLRLFLLSGHYRQPLNFTFAALDSIEKSLIGLEQTYRQICILSDNQSAQTNSKTIPLLCQSALAKFIKALNDDLNTPKALSSLFSFEKELLKLIRSGNIKDEDWKVAKLTFEKFDSVIGAIVPFYHQNQKIIDTLSSYANEMIEQREIARKQNNFVQADSIREELLEKGIILEDSNGKTVWKLKPKT